MFSKMTKTALVGGLILAGAFFSMTPARASEIVPAVGLTNSRQNDQVNAYGSLAFRGNIASALQAEIGAMYRQETFNHGDLRVHMWPITASLYVTPTPQLYLGGGVGWYNTTLDYRNSLNIPNSTTQKFGVHVGGGVQVPVSESVSVDLGGRYTWVGNVKTKLQDLDNLKPDFWTTQLGLAFKLH